MRSAVLLAAAAIISIAICFGEFGAFDSSPEHPAIGYYTRPVNDAVSVLNRKIRDGSVTLRFDPVNRYLRSALEALDVSIESQMMVFSKTSLQKGLISPRNPRSIFFNDSVAVAWVPGEPFVEVAAEDPRQGVIFYTLNQVRVDRPQFARSDNCLQCHESNSSLGVPGMLARSVYTDPDGQPLRRLGDYLSDHRSPFEERFGGWFVTGKTGPLRHMGNAMVAGGGQPEFVAAPDLRAYLSPHSDVAAILVFQHQMRMINLLTRAGWEIRLGLDQSTGIPLIRLIENAAEELVDYLLFVDEAPFSGRIQGSSEFAQKFAAQGPRDRKGRSLRQLDLERRLMRYPCSYMIYSAAFDGLPDRARDSIYRRMWHILSGEEKGERYRRRSLADRQAIVEILRDTRKGLPDYFQSVGQ